MQYESKPVSHVLKIYFVYEKSILSLETRINDFRSGLLEWTERLTDVNRRLAELSLQTQVVEITWTYNAIFGGHKFCLVINHRDCEEIARPDRVLGLCWDFSNWSNPKDQSSSEEKICTYVLSLALENWSGRDIQGYSGVFRDLHTCSYELVGRIVHGQMIIERLIYYY